MVVCVRAGLSSPRMMNDPRVPPSLMVRTLSWPYRLSASTFDQRVRPPSPLLSSPLVTPLHLDISFPSRISLIFPSPPHHRVSQRGGFRSLPLLPPARSFYFSFIFPTREPSRCNLHPSCCCCCCRRPSRLPRATIGVEACDSPGKIVVSGKKILLISIEAANNRYESIFYYKHEEKR